MLYTREEYKNKLIPQGKMIEEFIAKEIQPHLSEKIIISFGEIVRRGSYNEIREHEFTLIVRKDKTIGTCGGLILYFEIPSYFKGCCGYVDIFNDYGYGGEFIYNLCLHWQQIKWQLLREVKEQKASKDAVLKDFVI